MKIFPPLAKKFPLSSTSPFHRQVLSSASTCVSSGLSTNRISLSKMALLYRGESRKKILKHPVFWIKVMEITLALIIFPMCVTYSDKGGVYKKGSNNSFNITVKYPFIYKNDTAVYTNQDAPIDSFSFDPAIHVCAKLFVGVTMVTCIAALTMMLISCAVHRNEHMGYKVMIAEIFVAVVMAFLLVISTSLWLYNLLELRKEVEDEIVNVITTVGPELCDTCVEFLPNYAMLFTAVGLAYVLFVLWLCNTVLVFLDTVNQSDGVTDTTSLVWNQELADKSPETQTVKETTAT